MYTGKILKVRVVLSSNPVPGSSLILEIAGSLA